MKESRKSIKINLFIVDVVHWISLLGFRVILREIFVSFFREAVEIFYTFDRNSCHHHEPFMTEDDCAIVSLSDDTTEV